MSHKALMRSWKRLVTWREGDREVRRIVDAIEDAKRKWMAQGKKRRDLLEGRLLKDGRRSLKDSPAEVFGAKGFIQKSLWWRRSEFASWLMIPICAIGLPSEYFWREESIQRDRVRIEQLGNGDVGEREAVLTIAGGCWAEKQLSIENKRNPDYLLKYFWERAFGNCRSLENTNLNRSRLQARNLSRAFLISANLSGADLYSANLSKAFLVSANLSGANLYSADLSGAFLVSANLSRANLHSANLSGADLYSANLSSAKLTGTNLSGAKLGDVNLQNVKFECETFKNQMDQQIHECPNLKDIKWNKETNWKGIQGWETVENIPPALKQQLGLKN